MGRMKENCRYNVVSLRVTDEERKALKELTALTKKNLSTILREAILLLPHLPPTAPGNGMNG